MNFRELPLQGAYVVEIEPHSDERGYFARTFCAEEFAARGLDPIVSQSSVSYNARRGTLRGLHWQVQPHGEVRLVSCGRGALWDVIVDVRPASATFGRWAGVELSARCHRALYVPPGFAHGFQTLEDNTDVLYQISTPYVREASRGVRWNDPTLAIEWPETNERIISERDQALPLLKELDLHG